MLLLQITHSQSTRYCWITPQALLDHTPSTGSRPQALAPQLLLDHAPRHCITPPSSTGPRPQALQVQAPKHYWTTHQSTAGSRPKHYRIMPLTLLDHAPSTGPRPQALLDHAPSTGPRHAELRKRGCPGSTPGCRGRRQAPAWRRTATAARSSGPPRSRTARLRSTPRRGRRTGP